MPLRDTSGADHANSGPGHADPPRSSFAFAILDFSRTAQPKRQAILRLPDIHPLPGVKIDNPRGGKVLRFVV
jgi:hypothetical protein